MKKRISLCLPVVLAALLNCAAANAAEALRPDLASLASVPRFQVDGASAAAALLAAPHRRGQPPHFAAGVALPLSLDQGRWDALDSGHWSWRVRVGSPGARLLNFKFDQFQLPASGRLYIYDAQGQLLRGPYTAANQNPDGRLWTAVVQGAEAVIELRVDAAERSQVRLHLDTVYHGYQSFTQAMAKDSGLTGQSAASCEVNVACPAGANWPDEIRSTAVYSVADDTSGLLGLGSSKGEILCTGDLVNDVPQDNTPYFLTAHHCQVGWDSDSPASSMVVYWNYQASTCDATTGSLADSQTGASFDATDTNADFNLVTLNQQPDSAWNVHYAGWDATGNTPQSGVGIHHPVGDIKKISTYSSAPQAITISLDTSNGSYNVESWEVSWAQGITEDGSSGSGLWDQNHHIVGTLSGGSSACPATAGAKPTGTDVYGRLAVAWTDASGTGGSLKQWLDPKGTGTTVLDGVDPGQVGASSGGSGGGGAWPLAGFCLAPLVLLRRRRRR